MSDYTAQDKRSWHEGDRVIIVDEHLACELGFWVGVVEAVDFESGFVHVRSADIEAMLGVKRQTLSNWCVEFEAYLSPDMARQAVTGGAVTLARQTEGTE